MPNKGQTPLSSSRARCPRPDGCSWRRPHPDDGKRLHGRHLLPMSLEKLVVYFLAKIPTLLAGACSGATRLARQDVRASDRMALSLAKGSDGAGWHGGVGDRDHRRYGRQRYRRPSLSGRAAPPPPRLGSRCAVTWAVSGLRGRCAARPRRWPPHGLLVHDSPSTPPCAASLRPAPSDEDAQEGAGLSRCRASQSAASLQTFDNEEESVRSSTSEHRLFPMWVFFSLVALFIHIHISTR